VEAICCSETSGYIRTTRHYNPEDHASQMFAVGYKEVAGWIDELVDGMDWVD
jgi:hypothetical protein